MVRVSKVFEQSLKYRPKNSPLYGIIYTEIRLYRRGINYGIL